MSTFWYALLLIIVYYSQTINGIERPKKVLVFMPISGHSHLKFMGTIANILQDEGYNVVSWVTVLFKEYYNIRNSCMYNFLNFLFCRPFCCRFLTKDFGIPLHLLEK